MAAMTELDVQVRGWWTGIRDARDRSRVIATSLPRNGAFRRLVQHQAEMARGVCYPDISGQFAWARMNSSLPARLLALVTGSVTELCHSLAVLQAPISWRQQVYHVYPTIPAAWNVRWRYENLPYFARDAETVGSEGHHCPVYQNWRHRQVWPRWCRKAPQRAIWIAGLQIRWSCGFTQTTLVLSAQAAPAWWSGLRETPSQILWAMPGCGNLPFIAGAAECW